MAQANEPTKWETLAHDRGQTFGLSVEDLKLAAQRELPPLLAAHIEKNGIKDWQAWMADKLKPWGLPVDILIADVKRELTGLEAKNMAEHVLAPTKATW
jgi:hypothetical protein